MMSQLVDEPLQDHISMLSAAAETCQSRNKAALILTNARATSESKSRDLDTGKTKGATGKKLAALETEFQTADAAQQAAQKKLDKFAEHLSGELAYFHRTRSDDLRAILTAYSDSAFLLNKNVTNKWGVLTKHL